MYLLGIDSSSTIVLIVILPDLSRVSPAGLQVLARILF